MFQKKTVKNKKCHFMFLTFFRKSRRFLDNVEKCGSTGQASFYIETSRIEIRDSRHITFNDYIIFGNDCRGNDDRV
jgi:hypothetical protein